MNLLIIALFVKLPKWSITIPLLAASPELRRLKHGGCIIDTRNSSARCCRSIAFIYHLSGYGAPSAPISIENFGFTSEQINEVLHAADHPNVGTLYDPGYTCLEHDIRDEVMWGTRKSLEFVRRLAAELDIHIEMESTPQISRSKSANYVLECHMLSNPHAQGGLQGR